MSTTDIAIKSEGLDEVEQLAAIPPSLLPTRTWASLARSLSTQNTSQEPKAPHAPMFRNLPRKFEPLSREAFVERCLFAAQDDTKPDASEDRSDSGVDMDLEEFEATKSKEDSALQTAKKRKSAMHSSRLDGDIPKRRKGVVYPIKKCQMKSNGQRKQRSNYMSEERAEVFRAKQTEFLHDDTKNIISEIPRFTRGQKKMLQSEVWRQPARPQPSTGLLSPPNEQLSEDEQYPSPTTPSDICTASYKKPSKPHTSVRESNNSKVRSKKKDGVGSPDVEVETGLLQIVYQIAGRNTVLYSLPMELDIPHI
ncbi:hypothetical protein DL98DRAFT_631985 [Cadophora sp. DSE1049]|nr:hypothetical protein DL98DRAFT_631985 [Cadophora sp. DSE1049]